MPVDREKAAESAWEEAPIFIVGTSRSGTSVLREILNRHSELWVVRETHYFDDLRVRLKDRAGRPLDHDDERLCLDYFGRLGHRAYGLKSDPARSEVDPVELRDEARRLGGTADDYFTAFCRARAAKNGKRRWGEKTPRHIFRIAELATVYPSARVVATIRDPRGVAASYRDWKRGERTTDAEVRAISEADRARARRSYDLILNALLWRAAMRAALAARRELGDGRVYLVRYEELVQQPEATLRRLADWLGVAYQESMLEVPIVQSSYDLAHTDGISREPAQRWRSKLSAAEIRVIEQVCRTTMDQLGYRPESRGAPLRAVAAIWAGFPAGAVRATLANRGRLGRASEYVRRRLRAMASG